jgi:predicted RNase H-related nuclease YkuK (DUF458 family)
MCKEVEEKFTTGTGEKVNLQQLCERLRDFYYRNKVYDSEYELIVGTDSQNHSDTKIVTVICITCRGHGGILFYQATNEPRITEVRRKLYIETQESLELAEKVIEVLESDPRYEELYLNCPICIHVDAGNSPKGRTRELIPELVGWIRASGYSAKTKPDSFCASTIADRITKH